MKKLWILTGVIAIMGIIGGGLYFFSQTKDPVVTPGTSVESVPTPTPVVELATWIDDAGFSFQYPKGIPIDKNEDDNENYAHVELTNKDHPGNLIVWVSDLPKGVNSLDAWVKKDAALSGGTQIDSTLGKQDAKKILTSTQVTSGTISDNLLFYVQATLTDKEYWTQVFETVTASFVFTDVTASSGSAPAPAGGGAEDIDEEEVVQ